MNYCFKSLAAAVLFLTSGASLAWGQSFTNDAILIEKKKTTAVLQSSGMHEKKKEATEMAVKSAFDTYFHYGIEGLNNGKPLLEGIDESKTAIYLERFFDDKAGKYRSFVVTYKEDKSPQKFPNNLYKATVTLEIYDETLRKDLARNKLINDDPPPVDSIKAAQPTIMIVPFKQANRSYRDILIENPDYRNTVNRVQESFISKGYQIKDFIATLEATERSGNFESVEAFDAQLINNSGADVYVTIDAQYHSNDEGTVGSIALISYERASGKVLASKQASSPRYKRGTLTDLFRIAIGQIADDFLKSVTLAYSKMPDKGSSFVMRVSVGNSASMDLNSEVAAAEGLPLSDVLRRWLRQNSVNNQIHVQGATRDLLIFDQIQVAVKNADGLPQDANDFALEVFSFLKTLGITCDKRVDGGTIYITIEE